MSEVTPENDPGMEGTTTLDEPTAEKRIEALQFENAALKAANERADRNVTNLRSANQELQRHITDLGEALRDEAERCGWCEEYDRFAEDWDLPKCSRGWAVTVTVTVTARGEDEAIEFVKEHIRLREYTDGVVSGPEFDADEVNEG